MPIVDIYYWVAWYVDAGYQILWGWVNGFDKTEWLIMLAATTALGLMCMKGYGSRTQY